MDPLQQRPKLPIRATGNVPAMSGAAGRRRDVAAAPARQRRSSGVQEAP